MPISNTETMKFFSLSLPNESSNEEPKFRQMEKVNGEWKAVAAGSEYSGKLDDARIETKATKRGDKWHLTLIFRAGDEREKLDMFFNGVAKSIINTIANAGKAAFGADWYFRVYKKDDFSNVYITMNGQRGQWLFDKDQVKKIHSNDQRWADMFNKYIAPAAKEWQQENRDPFDDLPAIPDTDDTESPTDGDDLPF